MKIDIVERAPQWRKTKGLRPLARRAIAAAVAVSGVALAPGAEAALHLADDAHLKSLNARWRGKDKPTNVLSFPAARPDALAAAPLLGDIVLAFETLAREAEAQGVSFADHFVHLTVHGFLHLLGYDHVNVHEARVMEGLETKVLARLGIADPYRESVR